MELAVGGAAAAGDDRRVAPSPTRPTFRNLHVLLKKALTFRLFGDGGSGGGDAREDGAEAEDVEPAVAQHQLRGRIPGPACRRAMAQWPMPRSVSTPPQSRGWAIAVAAVSPRRSGGRSREAPPG